MDLKKILGLTVIALVLISPVVASNSEDFDVGINLSDSSVVVHNEVKFVASVSGDVDIDSYRWEFGDGDTAYGESVSHRYDDTGRYEVELRVKSESGKKRYAEADIRVTEFSSSVVSSADKIEIYISGESPGKTVEVVRAGKRVIVNIKPWESIHSVTQFSTSTTNYLGNIYVKVRHLGKSPESINDIPNSYTFTNLTLNNALESEIANSTVGFRVEKQWMTIMSANPEDIILKRHVNGDWQNLNTSATGENEEFYNFEAETPGFSVFGIAAKPRLETSTEVDKNIGESIFEDLIQEDFNELVIGRAGSENISATFTKDSMNYSNKNYQSTWKSVDYGLIEHRNQQTYIVGTHRYGTEAALMLYDKVEPADNTLVKWEDQNSDQEVQWTEVKTVKE